HKGAITALETDSGQPRAPRVDLGIEFAKCKREVINATVSGASARDFQGGPVGLADRHQRQMTRDVGGVRHDSLVKEIERTGGPPVPTFGIKFVSAPVRDAANPPAKAAGSHQAAGAGARCGPVACDW